MSWFWGSNKTKDATASLDPTLRDFLDKETARQQAQAKSTERPQSKPTNGSYREELGLNEASTTLKKQDSAQASTDNASVPPESLFQDGRYAHLWKTYRSEAELAAFTTSDQNKMAAVVDGMNARKAAIGRAALENCVVEQLEQQECYRSGSYSRLLFMCKAETASFNRCYEMQSRFLRALGYLSMPRTDEEEEKIQMHADKLYQNMLQREKDAVEAKAAGRELAPSGPLIKADEAVKALGADSNYARMRAEAIADKDAPTGLQMFTPEAQQAVLNSLKDMNEEERQLELQLLAAEARVRKDVSKQLQDLAQEEADARQWRKDNNQQSLAEKIRGWTGSKS